MPLLRLEELTASCIIKLEKEFVRDETYFDSTLLSKQIV
jgi:hypothetical protein